MEVSGGILAAGTGTPAGKGDGNRKEGRGVKSYVWKRTGIVVWLVAGCILFLLLFVGPFVYVWRKCAAEFGAYRVEWAARHQGTRP